MTTAGRKGRPPRTENGTTVLAAMRLDSAVYDRLRQEAAKANRSITAQAEMLLTTHTSDVGRMLSTISAVVGVLEERFGARWQDDSKVKAECIVAAKLLVDLTFGNSRGAADKPLDDALESGTRDDLTRRLDALTTAVDIFDKENGTSAG